MAKPAASGAALRETVSPYSAPTASSGGNPTDLYFGDALTIARARRHSWAAVHWGCGGGTAVPGMTRCEN
jgi:hypothetical protein